ncbi:MAG: spore coat protein U domain-containing protein [Hyphomicrobiaceae bacterium]
MGLVSTASPLRAQTCTFSITNIDFGNIDVTLNTTFTASGTLVANCTGIANRRVRVCPNLDTGTGDPLAFNPRRLANGASLMNYNLFRNSNYTGVWGSTLWAYPPGPPAMVVQLSGTGSGTASRVIYARVNANQRTLPEGTYTSSFSGSNTAIAYAYTNVGNCTVIGAMNAVQVPFTVSATNVATCRVNASDLNFGAVSALTSAVDQTGSASVTCTNQWPYRVLLDNGLTGTGPTDRRMTLGIYDVSYGLYRNAGRTLPWGDLSGVNSRAGTGSGLAQTITIHGRVPAQSLPPAGTYSDTIVMTVEY